MDKKQEILKAAETFSRRQIDPKGNGASVGRLIAGKGVSTKKIDYMYENVKALQAEKLVAGNVEQEDRPKVTEPVYVCVFCGNEKQAADMDGNYCRTCWDGPLKPVKRDEAPEIPEDPVKEHESPTIMEMVATKEGKQIVLNVISDQGQNQGGKGQKQPKKAKKTTKGSETPKNENKGCSCASLKETIERQAEEIKKLKEEIEKLRAAKPEKTKKKKPVGQKTLDEEQNEKIMNQTLEKYAGKKILGFSLRMKEVKAKGRTYRKLYAYSYQNGKQVWVYIGTEKSPMKKIRAYLAKKAIG